MKTEKVCLINLPTSREQDDIFFPMGPLVLASVLKQEQIPVEIVDFDLAFRKQASLRWEAETATRFVLETLEKTRANVFGISSICSNFPYALLLSSLIRKHFPESKILLGGPQPSSVPRRTLELFNAVDLVAIGEGERTLLELVRSDWSPAALKTIKGIAFRNGDKIEMTPARELIDDLDDLPVPDFSMLNLSEYLEMTPTIAIIEAGRGCPFACSFCSTATFWSRKYRAKSPARILFEMTRLHEQFGLKNFALTHDNFSTSPKYVRKFADYFIEHNTQNFQWSSSARTDSLLRCGPKRMRQAGCRSLFFGVDTGSQRQQELIDKHLDLEEFREVLQQTVNLGIRSTTSFILGYPEETKEELDETISLGLWAKKAGAREVQFHRLSPLAGTKIYDEYKNRFEFSGFSSDLSIPVIYHEEFLQSIVLNQDIFSSFFNVPTPHLEPINLFAIAQFFYVLSKTYGESLLSIVGGKNKSPLKTFVEWEKYYSQTYPNEIPVPKSIISSFSEFI